MCKPSPGAGNAIVAEGAETLAEPLTHLGGTLTELVLCYNSVGDDGALSLARVLPRLGRLEKLTLVWNLIRSDGCAAIADALQDSSWGAGQGGREPVSDSGTRAEAGSAGAGGAPLEGAPTECAAGGLRQTGRRPQPTADDEQRLSPDSGAEAERPASMSRLRELALSWNRIGPEGAASLAPALRRHPGLTSLGLQACGLGPEGMRALSGSLRELTRLETLDVARNAFEDAGGAALARVLESLPAIRSVDARSNGLGRAARRAIQSAVCPRRRAGVQVERSGP
jgi:hypothetical protein